MKNFTKFLTMLVVCLIGMQANAQNVTIGPDNGSLVTGQAGGNLDDSGIKRGMASMWRHEQLPLTMTTSDIANLTSAGELADPSCAIDKYDIDGTSGSEPTRLILGAGQTQTFIVVSLPKGFRITGYRLVLQPNIYGNGIRLHEGKNTWDIGEDDRLSFYETPAWSSGYPYGGTNTHSTTLECSDAIATATYTAANGTTETVMRNNNATNRAKEFVIQRTSREGDAHPMTNQLHFFFARATSQYAVSIKSFEIFFTAEGSFNVDVAPAVAGVATDYVTSPFTTSKMDVGAVTYNSEKQLYQYDYTGVQDLIAYTHLYQDNAVSGGEPAHVEGVKNIYPLVVDGKGAFAFGEDTYFIEPPTTIHTSSGWSSPIGFRVVGATFNYKWGTATSGYNQPIYDVCYIRGNYPSDNYGNSRSGGYLNDNLDITTEEFAWQIDEYGNIYKEYTSADGTTFRKYLACFGEGDRRILSLGSSATGNEAKWNLRIEPANGNNTRHIYYLSDGGNYYYLNWTIIQEGSAYHSRCYVTKDQTRNLAYGTTADQHTVSIPAFNPGAYKLKIYDKTGTQLATPVIEVNSAADAGTYKLEGLNNDAVKFEITDLEDGKQALVDVTLELQALNPYINSMDIVCKNQDEKFQLKQTFTSSDFRVSGGKFVFYIPSDYENQKMKLSFADLYSDYGDNTYYGETGSKNNSRYSFVTSEYFKGTPDLYTGYNPVSDYETKVIATEAGNIRFKFNNAEDLTVGTGDDARYLQDYLFDYNTYKNGGYTDPDATTSSPSTSKFEECELTALATEQEMNKGTYYLFTADETRYNIAPTTAWQHRYYAFYRMDIVLLVKDYDPELVWKKIYDKTCYDQPGVTYPTDDKKDTPAATVGQDSMWGLELHTGQAGPATTQYGYLTYNSIINAINTAILNENDPTKATGNAPKNKSQILYIDGSKLHSMVNSSKTTGTGESAVTEEITLSNLKQGLGENALVFLPESTTSKLDNVAYVMSNAFYAGRDIVLTDGKPFYSPYDIHVGSDNEAIYIRNVQRSDYEDDILVSMVLPYSLTVNNGVHTNPDNTSFSIFKMDEAKLFKLDTTTQDPVHNYGTSYFSKVGVNATTVNSPYMVNLDKTARESSSYAFAAIQKGATIVATTSMDNTGNYKYLFKGESVGGSVNNDNVPSGRVTLTPEGSYSGEIYDRAISNAIFYFADNKFLNLYKLMATKRYLYVYPFRAVYTFDGNLAPNTVKALNGLDISFDMPGETDGIIDRTISQVPDLAVRSGKGFIQMTSAKDQVVNVFSLNGTSYSRLMLNAGDSKTVTLPAGVYVVNNVKIIVK